MALTEPYTFTATCSTTELSLVSGTSTLQTVTDDGVYQVLLDLNALANGDIFTIRFYEKVRSADTKRVFASFTVAHAQGADNAIWISDSFLLIHGWDVTIQRNAGADRTITGSIRKVA